jgi:hypothetical protein
MSMSKNINDVDYGIKLKLSVEDALDLGVSPLEILEDFGVHLWSNDTNENNNSTLNSTTDNTLNNVSNENVKNLSNPFNSFNSSNPYIKKYGNFDTENISKKYKYFDGCDQNFVKKNVFEITKNGDIMVESFVTIKIPSIYNDGNKIVDSIKTKNTNGNAAIKWSDQKNYWSTSAKQTMSKSDGGNGDKGCNGDIGLKSYEDLDIEGFDDQLVPISYHNKKLCNKETVITQSDTTVETKYASNYYDETKELFSSLMKKNN